MMERVLMLKDGFHALKEHIESIDEIKTQFVV